MVLVDVALVGALVVALASGRVPPAMAFITFVLVVAVAGRLPLAEVLTLLADPALVAVVCLALFSGVVARISWIRRLLFPRSQTGIRALMARFLGITAAISSVVPNTAVVGAFMGPAASHPRVTPHLLLMPLSYMALAAGMLTPFGTSANLIVVGQASRSDVTLEPLDFFLPGLAAVGAVFIVLILVAPRLLREPTTTGEIEPEFFHVEATIPARSPLIDRTVLENRLRNLGRFFLAEVMRGDRVLSPVEPTEVLAEGDVLVFVGDVRYLDEVASIPGLATNAESPAGRRHETSCTQSLRRIRASKA